MPSKRRKPVRGHRTRTGSREIEVKVTRDRRGRIQYRNPNDGKYTEIGRENARQKYMTDRVDKRLRWGSQADGWWYIPEQEGGKYHWVRQQDKPTVINGWLYKPGAWWPYTTKQRPGLVDEHGHAYAPPGAPAGSAVPWDVNAAAGIMPRSVDPSTRSERLFDRVRRAFGFAEGEVTRGDLGQGSAKGVTHKHVAPAKKAAAARRGR